MVVLIPKTIPQSLVFYLDRGHPFWQAQTHPALRSEIPSLAWILLHRMLCLYTLTLRRRPPDLAKVYLMIDQSPS